MEEQKEVRRVSRLNYAKQHPIQKRSRKDSIIPKETLSVDARGDVLHEEINVLTTGNNNDIMSHLLI
jgi:hypothetical protein